ncbi:unnamed protein product [marine sediment metagenome]|uniref:Uncharacterized protein n=1 Tax=marine sediment metagenome TaxID=412755 RepID=X1J7V2_9ZZZZ
MDSKVDILLMAGKKNNSEPVKMVSRAIELSTKDAIEKFLKIKEKEKTIDKIVLSTNSEVLINELKGKSIIIEPDEPQKKFNFGKKLKELINKYKIEKLFYMGGGSGVLLKIEDLKNIIKTVLDKDKIVNKLNKDKVLDKKRILITNNLYSTDFIAFSPANIINSIEPFNNDNEIAWILRNNCNFQNISLPRNAATQLDIDTPIDLLTIKNHPALSKNVKNYIESLDINTTKIEEALKYFAIEDSNVIIAGRTNSTVWSYLEDNTVCRVRLFAEERGMRASGRRKRGEVHSLLGFFIQEFGIKKFFEIINQIADAAFIDSRVILSHFKMWPSANDRFYSDLLKPGKISEPFLREFTYEALNASIPIVLGGHSLVSGGLYALVESAWVKKINKN